MSNRYLESLRTSLEKNTDLDESWVQQQIADDRSILELGDLVVRDTDRENKRAGWPDLLLQDCGAMSRYAVHLQLGASDEAQIIRAIESCDMQKKSLPQYKYCAVLIAEDIGSRHLNVLSLISETVPFIAIQMQAFQVGEYMTLLFSKVIGNSLGSLGDTDEDVETTPTDRAYWEQHASKETSSLGRSDVGGSPKHRSDPESQIQHVVHRLGKGWSAREFRQIQTEQEPAWL